MVAVVIYSGSSSNSKNDGVSDNTNGSIANSDSSRWLRQQ